MTTRTKKFEEFCHQKDLVDITKIQARNRRSIVTPDRLISGSTSTGNNVRSPTFDLLSVDTAPPGSHATANLGGAVFFVNNLGDVRPKL